MYPKGNKNSWNDDSLRVNYNLNEDSIVIDLGGYVGWFTDVINEKYKRQWR